MLSLCAIKLMASITLSVGLGSPALASEIEMASQESASKGVIQYNIDHSARPVVVSWNAEEPTAILVAVHGLGLHKRSFEQFAVAMKDRGVSTYSLDVRGFGGWTNGRKSFIDFDATFEDMTALIKSIRSLHPDKPLFLIGESMGGGITLAYAERNPKLIDGVISAAPAYDRFGKFMTDLKIGASSLITGGRHVALKSTLVGRTFSSKELKTTWERDPDSKLSFALGDVLRFSRLMKSSQRLAVHIHSTPILLVQGAHDRLIKPEATRKLFSVMDATDKQLLEVPKGEHLTFEDGQFTEAVVSQVDQWIVSHSNAPLLSASSRL